jgi:polyhydroxybutyrate depolymerase
MRRASCVAQGPPTREVSFRSGLELLTESIMKIGIRSELRALMLVFALFPWVLACSSEGPQSSGSGNTPAGTAGQLGSAGTSAGSGGAANSSGGQMGTGGAPAGSTNGGSPALGGASGGSSMGASTGTGGSGAAAQSGGCGKAAALMSGKASIDVGGVMREYILAVPANYDQNKAYKLIFGWHPWGGSAQQVASGRYYSLESEAKGEAIFVAAEGLEFGGNGLGWGNTDGQDLDFLSAMLERFRAGLCIDENRIFSVGFSFGGMMSFAAGCSPMAMMRAIAPMAGNIMVAGCEDGTRPVAVMGFHGTHDGVVDISGGQAGRDVFIERNGCTTETMPAQPSWCDGLADNFLPCSCVAYQGCAAGYPVTWCEYNADHMPAPSSGKTLWSFFSQF